LKGPLIRQPACLERRNGYNLVAFIPDGPVPCRGNPAGGILLISVHTPGAFCGNFSNDTALAGITGVILTLDPYLKRWQ
jgi:hypothetical protein